MTGHTGYEEDLGIREKGLNPNVLMLIENLREGKMTKEELERILKEVPEDM